MNLVVKKYEVSPSHLHCSHKPFTCYCKDTCIAEFSRPRREPSAGRKRSSRLSAAKSRNRVESRTTVAKVVADTKRHTKRGTDVKTSREPIPILKKKEAFSGQNYDRASELIQEMLACSPRFETSPDDSPMLRTADTATIKNDVLSSETTSIFTAAEGLEGEGEEVSFSVPIEERKNLCTAVKDNFLSSPHEDSVVAYINLMYEKVVMKKQKDN